MSDVPHHQRRPIVPNANEHELANDLTRRTVLAGAAAATAIAAVDTPASAKTTDPRLREDMILFVVLSAALTGILDSKLAPGFSAFPPPPAPPVTAPIDLQKSNPGSDPIDIKQEYFDWVRTKRPKVFKSVLHIVREAAGKSLSVADRAKAIMNTVQATSDTKYLARSIVLMWYLGAWYDPDHLQAIEKNPKQFAIFQIISPKAYTQGWVWRVAQAHPMGFSEMQFGYWSHLPNEPMKFIGKDIPKGA